MSLRRRQVKWRRSARCSSRCLVGGAALGQIWFFWVAPLIGGIMGGIVYRL
jgi:glycerol uptake facilitator-like aquaporin